MNQIAYRRLAQQVNPRILQLNGHRSTCQLLHEHLRILQEELQR